MKKYIFLFCVCIFILGACSSNEETKSESRNQEQSVLESVDVTISPYDMQQNYNVYLRNLMCELNDVYYFIMDTKIHFFDKKTNQMGVLCGKPECDHMTDSCNGHVIYDNFLASYDGKIYLITSSEKGTELYRVNPDGTGREVVRELNSLSGMNGRVYLHREHVYTSICNQQVKNGKTSTTFEMYQYDLENGKPDLLMTFTHEYIEVVHYHIIEDYIYFAMQYTESESSKLAIRIYDITSKSFVSEWEGEIKGRINNFIVKENSLYFVQRITGGNESALQILQYDLESQQIKESKKMNDGPGTYHISRKYIHVVRSKTGTFFVMDYNGKIMEEGALVEGQQDGNMVCRFIGEDGEALLYQCYKTTEDRLEISVLKWTPQGVEIVGERNVVIGRQ